MTHVFPRHTRRDYPVIARGAGCYLYDRDGKQYLDGSGGAAVSCLGHGDAGVLARIKAQVDQMAFAHTGFFTSEPAEALAALLIEHAPGDLERVYFVCGGSEAMEAALKLARQYFIEIGQPDRCRVIARRQSYHGNTLGVLAAGGNPERRRPFAPLLVESSHIAPCYAYRGQHEGESDQQYGLRMAAELEAEIEAVGAERVMAFVAEPVVGATLGAVPPVAGYFRRIRELCDHYGILLILDEVMCGMGRTGTLYACEQDGIAPDIMGIAKGLGAGYQPIGAMLCRGGIYQAIEAGSGMFQHGHTYLGHPVACAAGQAVVEALLARDLVRRSAMMGEQLGHKLQARFADHPYIGDIRGRGLFRGVEIVRDRDTRAPFDPCLQVHKKLGQAAFANGLICYPMGGTVDGLRGDHVLLAPPFIIQDNEVDELVDKLAVAVDTATGYRA